MVGADGYSTINAAVLAASPGETIRIQPGTYREQVDLSKEMTLEPSSDGTVIIDGECQRDHGVYIGAGSGIVLRGLTIKRTVGASILVEQSRPDAPPPSNITIDGMTLQDFDCQELSDDNFRGGLAFWYSGPGMRITNNVITRRTDLPGKPRGYADGIWFKSNDGNPSGGGHTISGNTIIGGWDAIGGEEEGSAHGSFDGNTTIENNTIRDCWDDGIQVEGGDQNVVVRNNDIAGCGDGIAFAAPISGPLYVERNRIHDLRPGLYGNLFCFKVGNPGGGTTYLTENVCDVDSPSEVGPDGGADGIHQTNEGLSPIVSRRNIFQTGRYVFEIAGGTVPESSFDEDCLSTTDPDLFIKWTGPSGTAYYHDLPTFADATGQEPNGRQATDCSFIETQLQSPGPSPTPPHAHAGHIAGDPAGPEHERPLPQSGGAYG